MLSQVLYWNWQASAKLVIYPPYDIRKTAEYLYANPLPTPTKHAFYPEPGQAHIPRGYHDVCVYGEGFINSWLINGSHLSDSMYNQFSSIYAILTDEEDMWGYVENCVAILDRITLSDGIHLAEIRFGGLFSLFFPFLPSPNSYQWAFKIEPSPTVIPTPTP
jgi:hypothetical protein